MGSFEGKVAVVTGAARGIGRQIAEKLAALGADVAVCDLQVEWLADTAAAVQALGRKVLPLAVDVGNGDAVNASIAEVIKTFGKVDVMVNNAGITKDTLLVRMTDEDWDAVLRVNLKGTFLCCQAVIPQMMKQGKGRIVNIGSTASIRMTFFGSVEYTASKHGQAGLTQHLAWELADSNITVNTVCPGGVQTPLMEAGTTPEYRAMTIKRLVPLGRFTTIEEIGEVVSFLASDRAAMITGQMIAVDGGLLTGFGEDLRAVVRKRMEDLKVAHEAKK